MKITDLQNFVIDIPRSDTLKTSYGSNDTATTVLTIIKTDVGLEGYGQASVDAPFYGETAESMFVNIEKRLPLYDLILKDILTKPNSSNDK